MNSQKSILLLKIDGIGDYVLFRNFIANYHEAGYRVFLIGNEEWKDLTSTYDSSFIHQSFWLNRDKFSSNRFYRLFFIFRLLFYKFDITVNYVLSRNFYFDDYIISNIKSKIKIGYDSDTKNQSEEKLKISTTFYSTIVTPLSGSNFDFYTYRHITENVLSKKIAITRPALPKKNIIKENQALVFPGASMSHKIWSYQNFITVINKLKTSYKLIFVGGKKDQSIIDSITKKINVPFENYAGKTTLSQVCDLLESSCWVLSNDTAIVHIAAALQTPCVVVWMGENYGRFLPYPPEMEGVIVVTNDNALKNNDISQISVEETYNCLIKIIDTSI